MKAYNSMEEELTGRVTAYVGNAANNELFSSGYNAETSSMDYIGIPRMYWYGELRSKICTTAITSQTRRTQKRGVTRDDTRLKPAFLQDPASSI